MDFPDLNFIRSDIDPTTVKPIESRELIRLVNGFLITTADLLDNFCERFEQRLLALESRMDSLEKQLLLLERRLAKIPAGPANTSSENSKDVKIMVVEESAACCSSSATAADVPAEEESKGQQLAKSAVPLTAEITQIVDNPPRQVPEDDGTKDTMVTAKEHPTLSKYFRMLRMGVPEPGVKQKMRSEGVDPAILDTPDQLMMLRNSEKTQKKRKRSSSASSISSSASSSNSCVS